MFTSHLMLAQREPFGTILDQRGTIETIETIETLETKGFILSLGV